MAKLRNIDTELEGADTPSAASTSLDRISFKHEKRTFGFRFPAVNLPNEHGISEVVTAEEVAEVPALQSKIVELFDAGLTLFITEKI